MDTFIFNCQTSLKFYRRERLFSLNYAKDLMGLDHQVTFGFSVFEFEAAVTTKDQYDLLSMDLGETFLWEDK